MTWAVILLKEKKLDIQNCSYRQEMSQVSTNGSESLSFKLEILQRQFCKKKKKRVFWDLFLSFSHQPWNHKIIVHVSKPGHYQNHLGNF